MEVWMYSLLGGLVGALMITFLVSRLLLWIMRSWKGGVTRLTTAHVFSWIILILLHEMDDGAFVGGKAAGLAIAQIVWLLVDIWRYRRSQRKATAVERIKPHFG